MNEFKHRIITASAGTGKTYRIALEYIRIMLTYYRTDGFSLDNILVLTFTRKATAELRERINRHLEILCSDALEDAQEKSAILASLRPDNASLTVLEQGILLSAYNDLSLDRKKLQVMTIDSYIGGIFRNIVCPLRSIDKFEIDLQAVDKRLPFLFEHLMSPQFKAHLDSLLSRKISPSLDEYRSFFASLIEARWLFHQIQKQAGSADKGTLLEHYQRRDPQELERNHSELMEGFERLFMLLQQTVSELPLEKVFVNGFKSLFKTWPDSYDELLNAVYELCSTSRGCQRLFSKCSDGKVCNGQRFKAKKLAQAKHDMLALEENIGRNLANYLVHAFLIPEQEEILNVWEAILVEYDKLIYRYQNMTYDDVTWFTLEALFSSDPPHFDLKNEATATEFYQFLSHRSRFILIDEFQDTSLMQFAILRPIIEEVAGGQGTKDFGGVIVVGDEKQSIFGWRGGERELLLRLRDIFPSLKEAVVEPLEKSWRSSKMMVDFVNFVFAHQDVHANLKLLDLAWNYEPIQEAMDKLDPLTHIEFQTAPYNIRDPQANLRKVYHDFVANTIVPALEKCPDQEMAVLCRTGKELETLQQILDEFDKPSIYQPSNILPNHAWVSPLIAWLRWLAFRDWTDFLEVLRSNYVMLKAAGLKAVADEIWSAREAGRPVDFAACATADGLHQMSLRQAGSMSQTCLDLVDLCLPGKNASERDFLNIHAFISLVQDFELAEAERDKSIPAFLDYLDNNGRQDFLKQVSVEGGGTLQLMTIHQSKGLQFDRVFLFYDLSGHGGSDTNHLKCYVDYAGADFQTLKDVGLTYNYAAMLKRSDYRSVVEKTENRDLLEEMNILYVAYTRAKTALHIWFAYQGSKGWTKYFVDKGENEVKLPQLICNSTLDYFASQGIEPVQGDKFCHIHPGPVVMDSEPDNKDQWEEGVSVENLAAALPAPIEDPFAGVEPNPVEDFQNLKKLWLEDRQRLLGNLAHHYLSFVKSNLPQEHEHASAQCLARFGSLLSEAEITGYIRNLRTSLPLEKIFVPGYDKLFTELTVYHAGNELRLDRLLVDTAGKRALILDYKTGSIEDPLQLERYRAALLSLEVFRKGGYRVDTAYLKLRI